MKICTKCKVTKPLEEFHKLKISKDGLHTYCKECKNSINKKYYKSLSIKTKKERISHKEAVNKRSKETKARNREKIREYLGGRCYVCGFESFKEALEVHHLDASKKDKYFANMAGWSWKRIEAELKGTVLLCSNCHKGLHYNYFCLLGKI